MILSDLVKSTEEWQALNRIWKSITPEQQTYLQDEFRVITAFIRENTRPPKPKAPAEKHQDDYRYLNRLSAEAKEFVIAVVESGEKNIYHSVMATLGSHSQFSPREFKEYYFERYGKKRPYLLENKKLVEEVIDLCWDKRNL